MFFTWLEPKIKEQAGKGERHFDYWGHGTGDTTSSDKIHIRDSYTQFVTPPFWQRICARLKELGYRAEVMPYKPTERPKVLGLIDDDNGDWRNWSTYYIKKSW